MILIIVWNLYEQICQAALDIGDKILVEVCLEELVKKFPNSIRVQKLQGLYYEQQGIIIILEVILLKI